VFRVDVDSLEDYFNFDPRRRADLQQLDALIRKSAPGLKRYFHKGTPAGEPGMRFKMIGYGKFHYLAARSGKSVEWPAVGVALQKSYISVYLSGFKEGSPLVQSYAGELGELRIGRNNFSFKTWQDLDHQVLSALFREAAQIFSIDDAQGGAKPSRAAG